MSERIGKYQILGELGKGAHSTIVHIRRNTDAKHYALKIVPINGSEDHKFLEQARHEFRIAQMLDQPNLIKIYALETQSDWLFRVRKVQLLIEYVNGRTLDALPRRLPLPKLTQVFVKVAAALVHMHRRGVYHADLKPNNILLSRTNEVKVFDYGLAWVRGEHKGRIQGTPEYMAPETVRHSMINEKTDIYNFGATMYRLVTLRHPPQVTGPGGLSLDAKTWAQMLKPVEECNADAPAALAELIHHCLAYKANQRPERMSEIQGQLDHLADKLMDSSDDKLEALEW